MPFLPTHFQRALVARSQQLLIASNRHPLSRWAGLQAYEAMRVVITARFRRVEGVRALYLCRSLAAGECYPGLSDFDLVVVFASDDPIAFYDRIRRAWGDLKRYFPINDLSILTVEEFERWQTIGGGWDPLDEVARWRLLAGEECRRAGVGPRGASGSLDRMQWALGHFQNLVSVALKEEPRSPFMAIVARRQLYKCFWNVVLALEAPEAGPPALADRVDGWIRRHGRPEPVAALQAMAARLFRSGPVTTVRFSASALAFRLLDDALAANPLLTRTLRRPAPTGERVPIANLAEVEERTRTFTASVVEMLGETLESVILGSTGTVRGYGLYLVLRDGLSADAVATALRDLRAIHRVFDDPWFNEHLPAGVPIVCSRRTFQARLQTGRSSLQYFESFRRVLHGVDLYAACTVPREGGGEPDAAEATARDTDWAREHLLYSLYLHQIYLARLKPALHDYVTFYLPRLMLQRRTGACPATAEEAVAAYVRIADPTLAGVPAEMFDAYRGKDLDGLLQAMTPDTFERVWPLLRQGMLASGGLA